MQPIDFFRNRIDAMINMNDPLAVLANRLPWKQIEEAVATKFEHQSRPGQVLQDQDMFGATEMVVAITVTTSPVIANTDKETPEQMLLGVTRF